MSTEPTARAWIEVDGAALRRNLERVRRAVGPDVGLIPMVKADAYGLGVREAVRALEGGDPCAYGVASVAEGLELRGFGVNRPILVFSPVPLDRIRTGVDSALTFTVSDLETLDAVAAAANRADRAADIHVEVDTGMGRAGFPAAEVEEWGPALASRAGGRVRWKGIFTHFHSADEAEPDSVQAQVAAFDRVLQALRLPDDPDFRVHLCNSVATLRFPEIARHAVRPGIVLFGGRPGGANVVDAGVEPVAAVRARISLIREAPPGTSLGYGASYRAKRVERWATVGIGYGDGLPRALGNRGSALLRGTRVPIIGRISMDMTVVDISELGAVDRGDAVTFLGRERPGEAEIISLEEVATLAGTISYEVLTGFTPRLPRVWRHDRDG